MGIQQHVHEILKKKKPGEIFFPGEFRHLENDLAVNMSLSRLANEGFIDRVSKGVYYIPKKDKLLGKIPPSLENIAEAIAKRDHVRIRPAGDFALHKLGLTTQIPLKLVYVTDGAPRTIKIGRRSIVFKPTTPKKLTTSGKISSLMIQGLEALGQKNVTSEIQQKIITLLQNEDPKTLKQDAALAPAWISKILLRSLNKHKND